ncbi:HEAT repeat domain-containing protein [Flagellimonas sp. DF-77]|uniref:HEAT repeat domain-containing protein n=1 Tax=Flagellimonas algarum TaxID=3230298 RepID=UPI00339A04A0
MDKAAFINHIPDFLEGSLTTAQQQEFEKALKQNPEWQEEVDAYTRLFKAFSEEPQVMPSLQLRQGFEKMLEEAQQQQVAVVSLPASSRKGFGGFYRIAASIAVLIGTFVFGRYLGAKQSDLTIAQVQQEQQALIQTTMISLMENESASKRIQGVQYIEEFKEPDAAIVDALTDRMLNDENTNVRLTAMEALSRFKTSGKVKTAFITALETEQDPSMQIAIIQLLVEIQEKKAIGPMQRLLENEATQPFIKDEITTLLPKII